MKEKGNSSMKISNSAKYVIGVSAAVALLAGCTNGGSQLTPSSGMGTNAIHQKMGGNHKVDLSQTLIVPRSVKANLHVVVKNEHLVKPNCCALQKTLFVGDAFGGSSFTGAIYMFDYNTGASLGQVATPPEGFLEVQGGCSDTSGNVFFSNTALSTVDEYNHSGTYIQTINDPGQFPVGCSFDKSSGNLAISNIIDTSGGPGSISIWNGGSLSGPFFPPNMSRVYFIGYEGKTGTLWLSGSDSSGFFQYDSYAGGTFTSVGVHGASVGFPGTVQWSANTRWMNVGDQDTFSAPTFYQVDDGGNVMGSTVTTCTQASDFCDIVQATIKGPGLVGPDAVLLSANRFAYPAGGSPTLNYPAAYVQPIGSAVSPNKGGGD
jgi:hypothetical protein